jgi:cysteine desulfurase
MGVDSTLARCAVRVSLGSTNTPMQIEDFLKALDSTVAELKHMNTVVA